MSNTRTKLQTGIRTVTPSATTVLRLSLAFVFILFGGIKLWPASPADALVRNGVFFLPHRVFFPVLGIWEVAIGIGLLHPRTVRLAVYLLIPQIVGTQLPLITLPHRTWVQFPAVPSEIGVYILKNWILLSAGIVVLATIDERSEWLPAQRSRSERFTGVTSYLATRLERYGYPALRVTLAVAFIWFGGVTMLGVGSKASLLAEALSVLGPPGVIVILYGLLKAIIGATLFSKSTVHWSAFFATGYMLVSLVPLVVYPEQTFLVFPIAPSFEGVSILKDLVLVSGVLWIAARTTNPR